ncbi:MAG TPA: alpha/beta hydrolase-fold protein [Verrucomicrobiae bacterium]|nr:alpha/beta hydrolase-fold protein [Verrucomicrobiae bacterium]
MISACRVAAACAAVLAALAGVGPAGSQTPRPEEDVRSPRLLALRAAVSRGERGAVGAFWKELGAAGTPLLEPVPGEDHFLLVTMLYRGSGATKSVTVVALENHQLANERYLALGRMRHLASTDVWHRTYRIRSDARFTYRFSVDADRLFADLSPGEWSERLKHVTVDPLSRAKTTTRDGPVSLVELPEAPKPGWLEPRAGVAQGRIDTAVVGDAAGGGAREVRVSTPSGYQPSAAPLDLLVVLDGETIPESIPVPTILDNLVAARRLAPTLAVMVSSRDGGRIQDLWYSEEFVAWLRDRLAPCVRGHYAVTTDPARSVIAGRSLSGAAAFAAFRLPELFGNVLSQSGGFAARRTPRAPAGPSTPDLSLVEEGFPEGEWLTRQLAIAPRKPIRFYLEVGTLEEVAWELAPPRYADTTVLLANRHLRDVLEARGYPLTYHEYHGPHDPHAWRGTFGDALASLIGIAPAGG